MSVQVSTLPPCDVDDQHIATIRCEACEENFCDSCDVMIHERKKNRGHTRQNLQLVLPPVPCDSNATHIAVMYCEDCEENFCADCDYAFHSRKKTAGHARFEGARRPEDIEALAREAAAEAERAAAGGTQGQGGQGQVGGQAMAGNSKATSAAAAVPSKPLATASTPSAASPTPAASISSSSSSTVKSSSKSSSSASVPSATANSPAAGSGSGSGGAADSTPMTGAERAAQFKSAWDAKRKSLCKAKFNVGHWLGLSTDERKDLSVQLCQEVLVNPQPSTEKGHRLSVEWSVQSFWTTYEIAVQCVTRSGGGKKKVQVTTYKIHIDDMGRLQTFDVDVDGVAPAAGVCNIM